MSELRNLRTLVGSFQQFLLQKPNLSGMINKSSLGVFLRLLSQDAEIFDQKFFVPNSFSKTGMIEFIGCFSTCNGEQDKITTPSNSKFNLSHVALLYPSLPDRQDYVEIDAKSSAKPRQT
ncbi:MAG: hypothetical protein ABJL99_23515 [Aliishimia sp.]